MSIDRREDAGDFYPGGKVISTRPVATGGDVKHSEFAGLDVKTNTIPDLREAVRELGRRLGATVVTALAACVAVAATVQTVPVNDLDFDANPSIVTNVTFEGLADATNVYTKAETDAAIESNRVNIATNRVAISALSDSKLDKSGGTMTGNLIMGASPLTIGRVDITGGSENNEVLFVDEYGNTAHLFVSNDQTVAYTSQLPTVPTNVSAFNNDAGYLTSYTETDPTISAWAKAASKPTYTAAEVGATTPEDVTAAIRDQSLGGIWDAELQVWWTPVMRNGSLTYQATTNVNLNAEN